MSLAQTHRDLEVFKMSYHSAMEIFRISDSFPKEEKYSLTDQIRRSSRSVSANIAEAFRKRRYLKHFVSKLSDSKAEAAETQVWIDFAHDCKYIDRNTQKRLYSEYDKIIGKIVKMIYTADKWCNQF